MKCPNCGVRSNVEINLHSAGFSAEQSPIKECGACGLVWRVLPEKEGAEKIDIIKPARPRLKSAAM